MEREWKLNNCQITSCPQALPWPDEIAFQMSVFCPGEGEDSRLIRRTVIRQTVLTILELLRQISVKVRKRFPTYSHLVEAGVMTVGELRALERAQAMTDYPCYWIPITWASNIIQQAAEQGYIKVHLRLDTEDGND